MRWCRFEAKGSGTGSPCNWALAPLCFAIVAALVGCEAAGAGAAGPVLSGRWGSVPHSSTGQSRSCREASCMCCPTCHQAAVALQGMLCRRCCTGGAAQAALPHVAPR
jgi:hypothetical protein